MSSQSSTPTGVVFYDRLVGDGVAYINTGFNPLKTHSYLVDFTRRIEGAHSVFGASIGWDSNFVIQKYQYNNYQVRMFFNASTQKITGTISVGQRVKFYFTPQQTSVYKRDALLNNLGAYGAKADISKKIHLFGFNDNGTHKENAVIDFYEFSIKDSGDTLLLDLVPCTYLGEAGMWDMVSNTFFGNANTSGSFAVEND